MQFLWLLFHEMTFLWDTLYLYSAQKIFPDRVRVLGGLLGGVLTAAGHGCEARVRGAGRVHGAAACSERGTGGCESPVSVVALPWPSLPVPTSGTQHSHSL